MIYDAVERCYTVTNTNFAADLAALATAKSLTVDTTVNLIKRQSAETFTRLQAELPACGIYGLEADTQAKDQTKRDSLVVMTWDYYDEDTDPQKVAKQVELAAAAILRTIDRIVNTLTFGAGEVPGSVRVRLTEGFIEANEKNYWRRAIVTAPVWDRDEGL